MTSSKCAARGTRSQTRAQPTDAVGEHADRDQWMRECGTPRRSAPTAHSNPQARSVWRTVAVIKPQSGPLPRLLRRGGYPLRSHGSTWRPGSWPRPRQRWQRSRATGLPPSTRTRGPFGPSRSPAAGLAHRHGGTCSRPFGPPRLPRRIPHCVPGARVAESLRQSRRARGLALAQRSRSPPPARRRPSALAMVEVQRQGRRDGRSVVRQGVSIGRAARTCRGVDETTNCLYCL